MFVISRKHFLLGASALATTLMSGRTVSADTRCGESNVAFWQISLSHTKMPYVYTDAYRLHPDGQLEYAVWSDSRELSKVSAPARVSDATATAFRRMVERGAVRNPPPTNTRQYTSGAELGAYPNAEKTHVSVNPVPDDIAEFAQKLSSRLPVYAPDPGLYVWTKPVGRSGVIDIDLVTNGCNSSVARAIWEGLSRPRLVVRLDSGGQEYLSGALASRFQFGARFAGGHAAYGVIKA